MIKKNIDEKWYHKLIISPAHSPWKRYFDVWVLILVGYSCVTSLYYVAFGQPDKILIMVWDKFVEAQFITDLLLTFFTEVTEENADEPIRNLK